MKILLLCSLIAFCNCEMTSKVETAFKNHGIVPNPLAVGPKKMLVVSIFLFLIRIHSFISLHILIFIMISKVSYPNEVSVELGNILRPAQVKDVPTVSWEAEDGAYYSLVMMDPDAPSRRNPKNGQYRHWLVMNIPGSRVDEGEHVFEYREPTPPKTTGLHRYIFLVYKQPNGFIAEIKEPHTPKR